MNIGLATECFSLKEKENRNKCGGQMTVWDNRELCSMPVGIDLVGNQCLVAKV